MSVPRIGTSEILPLVRHLRGAPDPLDLYAALSDEGSRPDTLLLESGDPAVDAGRRSLLVARSMMRLTCRSGRVVIEALTRNGAALGESLALRSGESGAPVPDRDERARLHAPGPFDVVRRVIFGPRVLADAGTFSHFAAGILGYDLIDRFESLPPPREDPHGFPDFVLWIPDRAIVVDHVLRTTTIIALVAGGRDLEAAYYDAAHDLGRLVDVADRVGGRPDAKTPPPGGGSVDPSVDLSESAFAGLVGKLQEHIAAGDVFQIVPSRTFSTRCDDPLGAYARLRADNPTPWQFFVRAPEFALFGASPETAVRVSGRPRRVTLRPIAGTVARGFAEGGRVDPDLDARLKTALLTSPKELAEHLMLVDLARNDVARVSRAGTRTVSRLLGLESYTHVSHLVSEVKGELVDGVDALHAYAATLNMGTLVGAPKIRAAQLLRLYETTKRGAYGGSVGLLTHEGDLDTAIVIRAAFVTGSTAYVRAGAGVVLDSDPRSEAAETRHKAAAVLRALGSRIAA